ncbi:MAG: aminoacyl-tRNA hydrolase [Candidatus Wallbacteria bacterium]
MKIICGLGNPGGKYSKTRHNIGFMVVDELMSRLGGQSLPSNKFKGEYLSIKLPESDVILLKPQTYMNLSGESLRDFAGYFKVPHENIVIICDDVSLPFGKLRVREQGSDGGHNGLKSIFSLMGSNKIPRVRIGIGQTPPRMALEDFVLMKFSRDEEEILNKTVAFAADAAEKFIKKDITYIMNNFNNKFGFDPPKQNAAN